MSGPNRAVCSQIQEWILAAVPAAGTWANPHLEEPNVPDPDGGWAVWWEHDIEAKEWSTVKTAGGWQGMASVYGIRYWEPSPEQLRGQVHEDRMDVIQSWMDDVRNVLLAHTGDLPSPNADITVRGASTFHGETPLGAFMRGFEIAFSVPRPVVYT